MSHDYSFNMNVNCAILTSWNRFTYKCCPSLILSPSNPFSCTFLLRTLPSPQKKSLLVHCSPFPSYASRFCFARFTVTIIKYPRGVNCISVHRAPENIATLSFEEILVRIFLLASSRDIATKRAKKSEDPFLFPSVMDVIIWKVGWLYRRDLIILLFFSLQAEKQKYVNRHYHHMSDKARKQFVSLWAKERISS